METLRTVLATLLFLGGIACLVHGLSGGPLFGKILSRRAHSG